MRYYLLAVLLGASLVAGCGSGSNPDTGTASITDAVNPGRIDIPPAPPGAGTATYQNNTFQFTLQFPETDFALFDPPQYVTVLNNRVFELVARVLPQGEIFRPNVGLIVDTRFQGQPIDIDAYAEAGIPILSSFFEQFAVISDSSFTLDGHQAHIQEQTASWRAPDGTLVPFRRITLYAENRGNILIFTFTAPPGVFEANRATFQGILNSIHLL